MKTVNPTELVVYGTALAAGDFLPEAPATQTFVTVCEFKLTATFEGVTETYGGLTRRERAGPLLLRPHQQQLDADRGDGSAGG